MKTQLILILAIMIIANQISAQHSFDIRSLSLGKTSVANSYNSSALNYNPANIQFQKTNDDATVYLNLITNLAMRFNSDFASIDFYEKYFKKDNDGNTKKLSIQDKSDIMNKAGNGYSEFEAGINLFSIVVNSGIGSIGISLSEKAGSNIRMNADFLDIALYGYKDNHTYDFSTLKMGASWVRQINLTYANSHQFKKKNQLFDAIAYGISVKPQLGMYYLGTESNNLKINTNDTDIAKGSGMMNIFFAGTDKFKTLNSFLTPSGTGIGFDIGFNASMKNILGLKNINLGLSITDIGSINWKSNTYQYIYDGNFIVTDISSKAQLDSLRDRIKGTKQPRGEFTTGLPTTLRLGAMFKVFKDPGKDSSDMRDNLELANFSLELIQGLNNNFGSTTKPVIALGAELNLLNFISPRLGLTVGGNEKFALGFGLGMDFGAFDLDIGTNNIVSALNPKKASRLTGGISLKIKM